MRLGVDRIGVGHMFRRLVWMIAGAMLLLGAASVRSETVRYGLIGDYGTGNQAEAEVAGIVRSWDVDFVATIGDNNYSDGEAATIDANIGQFFSSYIFPYTGNYGPGSSTQNRFWPALGNHDWHSLSCVGDRCIGPYFDYFELPGNERYYEFRRGPVHLFVLNSDRAEPHGISSESRQAQWLQSRLAASTAPHKHVLLHHAPYSSSDKHGSREVSQWPFEAWGATAVFGAHDHLYERLQVGGIPYFVNGAGGRALYAFDDPLPQSRHRYNDDFGAMLIEADEQMVSYQFINRVGTVIDAYVQRLSSHEVVVSVAASSDDAEQRSNGDMLLDSSDLEMTADRSQVQTVGLRFDSVPIPPSAVVTQAHIQFQTDEVNSQTSALVIHSEAAVAASPFTNNDFDITNRSLTDASVPWLPSPWLQRGEAGPAQRTPDLAVMINEVTSNPAWQSGNPIVFTISGTGQRTAEAFDGDALGAALLQLSYSIGSSGTDPLVLNNPGVQTNRLGASVYLQLVPNGDINGALSFAATRLPNGLTLDPVSGQLAGTLGTAGVFHTTVSVSANSEQATTGFTWFVTDDEIQTASLQVAATGDDAEENIALGSVSKTSSDLELGADGGNQQLVGIRFRNVPIARDAIVTDAYLQFQADENASVPTTVTIQAQNTGDAQSFSKSEFDLSDRQRGSTAVLWSILPWTAGQTGAAQRSPNLKQLLQELIDQPQWRQNNALAFLISGTGVRTAVSYNGDAAAAPTLHLQYSARSSNTVDVRITDAQDDAEENLSNGTVALGSSDLELGQDGNTPQLVGMRFSDLSIPAGAVVTNAYIQFQADESAAAASSVWIRGEASATPANFEASPFNLSGRSVTVSQVNWRIPGWQAGDAEDSQRTPDLSAIIQEVIEGPDWQLGAAVTILASGTGVRSAEAVNGEASGAPVLHVEFRLP